MLILRVQFTEETMDNPKFVGISPRFSAIVALFSKGITPENKHVEELKKNPHPDLDEAEDLLALDSSAYNNFVAFDCDPVMYINDLDGNTLQKVFLQRLVGLPEDPMPEQNTHPAHDVNVADPPVAPKPVAGLALGNLNDLILDDDTPKPPVHLPKANPPAEVESPRHIALRHLFHPTTLQFSQEDVDAIGQRWRLEKGDAKFLSSDVRGQIALFTSQVDGGDDEGFIDGIDDGTRPDLTDEERERLKQLIRQLLNHPETDKPVQTTAPTTTKFVGDPVLLDFNVPYWIRALHATERWQQTRPLVEEAFTQSRSSDPVVQKDGQARLNAWKLHVRECSEGDCGPELVAFGERMYKCISDLEGGADPTSHAYQMFYVNT